MALTFADILAPVSVQTFYAEYFGRKPLYVPGTPAKFAHAMSWDEMTRLVNQTGIWSPASLMLVMDNKIVPGAEYGYGGVTRENRQGMLVDLEKVREWLKRGASIVLNDIDTLTPALTELASALESGPGGKVQANLYCSRREHQAFPSHFDVHDVYAVHVTGEKAWKIYGRHFEAPINHPTFRALDPRFHETNKGAVGMAPTLKPGDFLYIPRGYYHDALAVSDGTIHVAFSVTPVIGLDLVSALFERAVHDPLLRRAVPSPTAQGDQATDAHLQALAMRIGELAREPGFLEKFKTMVKSYRYRRTALRLPDDYGFR